MKKSRWLTGLFLAGLALMLTCFVLLGLRPCGWLDTLLQRSACIRQINSSGGEVFDIAFSPDGSIIATRSADWLVRLWRVSDGTLLQTLGPVSHDIAFSPDGSILATSLHEAISLWRVSDGSLIKTLKKRPGKWAGGNIAFTPDGTILASYVSYTIYLWRGQRWRLAAYPRRRFIWDS